MSDYEVCSEPSEQSVDDFAAFDEVAAGSDLGAQVVDDDIALLGQ